MIYTVLADGFEEIEALSIVDILRRAGLTVCMLSANGTKNVTGAHGISVTADDLIEHADQNPTLLFLPGGMPGVTNLEQNPEVIARIKRQNENNGMIAAICAAPKILGDLGLLAGKRATSYPGFEPHLKDAILSKEKVVVDGNIITSRGAGTAMELGFVLTGILKDTETEQSLRSGMIYE